MTDDLLAPVRFDAVSRSRVIATLFGDSVSVRAQERSGGGSINDSSVLTLSDGTRVFQKRNSVAHRGLFEEEARGLMALAQAEGPRVPRVLAFLEEGSDQLLLMEYIEPGSRGGDFHVRFGRALARLHRTNRNDRCGFYRDNHIGSTPQRNTWSSDWFRFFGEHRLLYQVNLARERGLADQQMMRRTENLVKQLPELLPGLDDNRPSLLHGDLWGGNYLVDRYGDPVLVDPAAYYGHREADLAMTGLFGGFSPAFYRAYQEEWPLEPGFDRRRDLYNLYHLLNHLNLFGSGYLAGCQAILRRF